MGVSNRRLQYEQAKRYGNELHLFVKEETKSWRNPVVTTEEIAEEFDMDEEEVIERLEAPVKLSINRKKVGDTSVWW